MVLFILFAVVSIFLLIDMTQKHFQNTTGAGR
jgi:hypothetical protein